MSLSIIFAIGVGVSLAIHLATKMYRNNILNDIVLYLISAIITFYLSPYKFYITLPLSYLLFLGIIELLTMFDRIYHKNTIISHFIITCVVSFIIILT